MNSDDGSKYFTSTVPAENVQGADSAKVICEFVGAAIQRQFSAPSVHSGEFKSNGINPSATVIDATSLNAPVCDNSAGNGSTGVAGSAPFRKGPTAGGLSSPYGCD